MSEKIIKFISGKFRIFSLLIILTSLIIEISGELPESMQFARGLLDQKFHLPGPPPCQVGDLKTIEKEVDNPIKNMLQNETGQLINLSNNGLIWTGRYCNEELGQMTYFAKFKGFGYRDSQKFVYIVYLDNNTIIDVRSKAKIEAEIKKLQEMQFSKIKNAADFSEPTLKIIEDRILESLRNESKTAVIPKDIYKTRLIEYDVYTNKILYYVEYRTTSGRRTYLHRFAVFARYKNGEQEITDVKSLYSIIQNYHASW